MMRKAIPSDIAAIAATYNDLLVYEEQNGSISNWKLGVYPTIAVPKSKVPTGTMYVLEENGGLPRTMPPNYVVRLFVLTLMHIMNLQKDVSEKWFSDCRIWEYPVARSD